MSDARPGESSWVTSADATRLGPSVPQLLTDTKDLPGAGSRVKGRSNPFLPQKPGLLYDVTKRSVKILQPKAKFTQPG